MFYGGLMVAIALGDYSDSFFHFPLIKMEGMSNLMTVRACVCVVWSALCGRRRCARTSAAHRLPLSPSLPRATSQPSLSDDQVAERLQKAELLKNEGNDLFRANELDKVRARVRRVCGERVGRGGFWRQNIRAASFATRSAAFRCVFGLNSFLL